ncbi:hypothetical protein N5D52_14865 [Pseudomonas sp. GD03860]|uniref:hypothetical protein n=1 Tax=Pseudomonas TaxID=286 RepID=UPI002364543D|nr:MULTISPECIES: hypothetical protein [Pseudomonas]MDD2056577.1 hypothetical protein [Pseudomonas putida]MDH0638227.1 hypothetical protein [Pseudomonas sp. GD03860]
MNRDHELYADSAQARALDRRLSGDDVHWAEGVTPEQAAENNRAWLAMIRQQEAFRKASGKKAMAAALDKMEAKCGNGAATRRTA